MIMKLEYFIYQAMKKMRIPMSNQKQDKVMEILFNLVKRFLPAMPLPKHKKYVESIEEDCKQAHSKITAIIFEECEKVSQEYQKRIREEYVPKTLMMTEEETTSELLEALVLILPLAKGYVVKNRVGSNQKYIEIAQQAIHKAQEEKLK